MRERQIFYGRWVVVAFSVTAFMSTGVRHAVGPFLKPIVADLGLDRASFSAVIALSLFLYGVFMPLAGMALDRFSVRAVSSAGFTVMLGALSDRFGRRPVLAAIYTGRILIFAGFFLIRDDPTAILVVAVLGGITMAGTGSMTSALTADIYGRFSVSSVFGLIFLVHQTGSALGSWLAGALFETTGGYGGGLRAGLRVPRGRGGRRPQDRQGRATDLARHPPLGDELTGSLVRRGWPGPALTARGSHAIRANPS